MPLLQIDVFGALHVTCGDAPITSVNTTRYGSRFSHISFCIAIRPSPAKRFAFLLWPDPAKPKARTNLRQLLHHLRRALPPDCCLLESDHHTVQWRRDPSCTVDAWEFDAAVERGALDDAAALYRDDLLSGLYDDWVAPLRAQYRERLAGVLQATGRGQRAAARFRRRDSSRRNAWWRTTLYAKRIISC